MHVVFKLFFIFLFVFIVVLYFNFDICQFYLKNTNIFYLLITAYFLNIYIIYTNVNVSIENLDNDDIN